MTSALPVSRDERARALRFIVCMGFVSLFADMTYEGAYSVLGPYLKELGASAWQVGIIAGIGEMLAASLRFFSGKFADRTQMYWPIALAGYAINLIVVPLLAFAGSWQAAALLFAAERTGKALRGPARDLLLSRATGKIGHGWGFGVHAAMDQTGAVAGPVLVMATVAREHHFAPAFIPLAVPAALAFVAMLAAFLVDPSRADPPVKKDIKVIPKVFWYYVTAAGLLACGFADFPMLSFHLQKTSLAAPETIPLLYAGAMAVNGASAMLFGKLFDRFGIIMLVIGTVISALSLPFGFLGGFNAVILSVCGWAIGLGAQDASLRAGIAQVVSMNKRGTAFGAFNGVFGIAWFLGSSVMGVLYDVSLIALVAFGMATQLAGAAMFYWLRPSIAVAAVEA